MLECQGTTDLLTLSRNNHRTLVYFQHFPSTLSNSSTLTILTHRKGLFIQHFSIRLYSKWDQTGLSVASTCISWIIALNWGDRSVHCFSSSMALSKFFTYSAYILRKGVSFCRMSPIRGVEALQEVGCYFRLLVQIEMAPAPLYRQYCSVTGWNSPFSHAFLQIWKQKLAVKGVDGGDIGEDVLHHIHRECPFICLLH